MKAFIGLLFLLWLVAQCWRTFPYFTTCAIIAFIFLTTGVD
jgi:hypothetical protein